MGTGGSESKSRRGRGWFGGVSAGVWLWVSVWAGGGCGGQPTPTELETSQEGVALRDVGELLRIYQMETGKPPGRLQDLARFEMAGGMGYQLVSEGRVKVVWGVALPDLDERPGQSPGPEVLAYEAGAPESGGFVMFKDRTVRKLTAEEFAAAPKAGEAK